MKTSSPFIDQSLGRGLARQSVRTIDTDLVGRTEQVLKGAVRFSQRPRPAQRFRENLHIFEVGLRGLLVASAEADLYLPEEETSESAKVLFVWDVRIWGAPFPRLAIANINISRRTGNPFEARLGAVVVSEHALQRVFQRLRTTETLRAFAELGDAAASIWIHYIRTPSLFTPDRTCLAATPHGLAYAEIDVKTDLITITTWIDEDKLRKDQRAFRIPGVPAKDVGVRLYSGAARLPVVGQILREDAPD